MMWLSELEQHVMTIRHQDSDRSSLADCSPPNRRFVPLEKQCIPLSTIEYHSVSLKHSMVHQYNYFQWYFKIPFTTNGPFNNKSLSLTITFNVYKSFKILFNTNQIPMTKMHPTTIQWYASAISCKNWIPLFRLKHYDERTKWATYIWYITMTHLQQWSDNHNRRWSYTHDNGLIFNHVQYVTRRTRLNGTAW